LVTWSYSFVKNKVDWMIKRILVISSHYPPCHYGGYEIRVKNIIDELSRRGHKIQVLTSLVEKKDVQNIDECEYDIERQLHLLYRPLGGVEFLAKMRALGILPQKYKPPKNIFQFGFRYLYNFMSVINNIMVDIKDTKIIEKKIQNFNPDVIYLGNILPLSRILMPYLAGCKIPIVFDEGGAGLLFSREDKGIWYKFIEEYISCYSIINAIKSLIVKLVCALSKNKLKTRWAWPADMHIFFNSKLNLDNAIKRGVPVNGAKVIHSSIQVEKFIFSQKENLGSPVVFILPGRITPPKGQIDAIRLLSKLQEQSVEARLTIVGEKWDDSYFREIKREIKKFHLDDRITFIPMVARDKLIELYKEADICFFPSYHHSGFSRIPLEAMSCGCILISYGNEGSVEIIRDSVNGFLVQARDYSRIGKIIKELISNPQKAIDIKNRARLEIEEHYSMDKYVDQIEEIILHAATGAKTIHVSS
jgi:glycosyltransferase involved in cell wall biosynthesis